MLDKKYLTKGYLYDRLLELSEELVIDVRELETYTYEPARNWGWAYNPEPEEEEWDENEELCACFEEIQKIFEGHPDDLAETILPYEEVGETTEEEEAQLYKQVMKILEEEAETFYNNVQGRRPSK